VEAVRLAGLLLFAAALASAPARALAASADELNAQGIAAAEAGDLEKAIASFGEAVAAEPKSAKYLYNLIKAERGLGRNEAALQHSVEHYHLLSAGEDKDRALTEMIELARKMEPPPQLSSSDRAALSSAQAALARLESADVARILGQVAEHAPWHIETHASLATFHASQNREKEAREALAHYKKFAAASDGATLEAKVNELLSLKGKAEEMRSEAEDKQAEALSSSRIGRFGFSYRLLKPVSPAVAVQYGSTSSASDVKWSDLFEAGPGLYLDFAVLSPDSFAGARFRVGYQKFLAKADAPSVAVPLRSTGTATVNVPPSDITQIFWSFGLLLGVQPIHVGLDLGMNFNIGSSLATSVSGGSGSSARTFDKIPVNGGSFMWSLGPGSQINLNTWLALVLDFRVSVVSNIYSLEYATTDELGIAGKTDAGKSMPILVGSVGLAARF
jgi:hypothetical protein